MSETNTKSQLPPDLVSNYEEIPFYIHNADLIDRAFDNNFYSEINKLKNIYNPVSGFYDPDYILDLLGSTTLKNILSDVTDPVSLTMILGGIYNIKGTKAAFEAILKITKIAYKQIVYTTLDNGCTEVTLVMEQGVRIDISDVTALIRFAKEVFPLCLSLSGITNCTVYSQTMDYTGYNEITLGQHLLDRSFVLDLSKMDTSYGATISSPSGSINALICNATIADQPMDSAYNMQSVSIRNLTSAFYYQILKFQRLDYELTLDTQLTNEFYFFTTSVGTIKDHEMSYTGYDFTRFGVTTNITQFRLDIDSLDRTMLRRLDGVPAYTIYQGLDYAHKLDTTKLDQSNAPIVIKNYSIVQRNATSDANMSVIPVTSSASTRITSADANNVINLRTVDTRNGLAANTTLTARSTLTVTLFYADLKLSYTNSADSQYFPALNV